MSPLGGRSDFALRLVADLGGLNLLVNAAGVIEPCGIEDANARARIGLGAM